MEHIIDDARQFGVRAQVEPDVDRAASEAYRILHLAFTVAAYRGRAG